MLLMSKSPPKLDTDKYNAVHKIKKRRNVKSQHQNKNREKQQIAICAQWADMVGSNKTCTFRRLA